MKASDYIKTFLPIFLVVLIYIAAIFFVIIPFFFEQLLNQKKEAIKELTVNTISLIEYFDKQVEKGEFDIETAQERAKNEIKSLRYGKDLKDYFWIIDTTRKVVMQPYQPQIIGDDLSDYKGENGDFLFLDIVKMVKKDGFGYINYKWQWKDDTSKMAKKISYVHLYSEWGWIVGSGIYVDDVEEEISRISKKIIYFSIILIAIIFLLAFYISYRGYQINKEKEMARESAIKSQEKYKEIVENATTIILKLDLEGNITFFNEFAQKLFGFKQEEIIGKSPVGTIFPGETAEKILLDDVSHIIGNFEHFEKFENWNITKSGEKKFITWNNKPIFTEDKSLNGVLAIGTDITERKKLLDQLAENERKFKLIFNSVTDGIIVFTTSGKIIEVNDTAQRRSGYKREEYLKIPMQAFLNEHPVLNFDNLVEELGGKDFVSVEVNYHSKYGEPVNIEVVARKIEYEGQEAFLAVTREITERLEVQHRIYNAVLEAEEKERSRVAKELHDGISPILSTIKLYSQSLKDCDSDELKNVILGKIEETINEAIQSLSDISNNLSPHILQNFGLIPALENFIDKIMDSKAIKFHLKTDLKAELGSVFDVTIYRIIIELINNTIKYAKAENIEISLSDHDTIYLKYVDDGIGFDYNSVIEKKGGMGLFNISNRVKSLKGYAKFSPKPGKGCKVEIELPKQENK